MDDDVDEEMRSYNHLLLHSANYIFQNNYKYRNVFVLNMNDSMELISN